MAHTKTIYNYNINTENNTAFVFSALATTCTLDDFDHALASDVIDEQFYNALVANTYGGDIPSKEEYWLELT